MKKLIIAFILIIITIIGYAQNKEYWFKINQMSEGLKFKINNSQGKYINYITTFNKIIKNDENFNYYFIINTCNKSFSLVNYDEKSNQISKTIIEQSYDTDLSNMADDIDVENENFQLINLYGTSTISEIIIHKSIYEAIVINKSNLDYNNEDFVIEIQSPTTKDNLLKSIVITASELTLGNCNETNVETEVQSEDLITPPILTNKEMIEYYNLGINDPNIKLIRKKINEYVSGKIKTDYETEQLAIDGMKNFDIDYFKSKFALISNEDGKYGGKWMTIVFINRPDRIFFAWVLHDRFVGFGDADWKEDGIKFIQKDKQLLDPVYGF